jgi:predicted lipid-binding transport protein (Tim44 family)
MKWWTLGLVLMVAVAGGNADAARRLGGGGSFGKQSGQVSQRQNAAQQPATAPNPANKQGAAPAPNNPQNAAAAPAKRPWGAMLGGLAAGLGLAWLAHSLGLGAEMGQALMIALLVFAGFALWSFFRRSSRANSASTYAYSGATAANAPRTYSPNNVGNDASARPWEGQAQTFQGTVPAASGSMIGAAIAGNPQAVASDLVGTQAWGVPADFDTAGFLTAAKRNFVTLQAAWDRSDIDTLRSMMTDDMAAEIKAQLADRASHVGTGPNRTEVITLDAKLLGIEELPGEYLASVEFNGIIEESPADGPNPFREVWNMSRQKGGSSGWLVAGVQALQ